MPPDSIIPAFVKRFTKLGAVYGLIGGAVFPIIMLLIGSMLMDIMMWVNNTFVPNSYMAHATPEGPITQPDPVDSIRYVMIALVFYGIGFGVVGLIGGSIAGALCGLVTGSVTRQFFNPLHNARRYALVLGAVTGVVTLISTTLVFGGIIAAMGQPLYIGMFPASLIAAGAAVFASQRIARWYVVDHES